MGEHTKEPWAEDGIGNVGAVSSDQWNAGYFTAECGGPDKMANARRIVACVNACAGIPTEGVEAILFATTLAEFANCQQELESALTKSASREAALAEALVGLRRVVPYFWNDDNAHISELDEACEKTDAALAKIKEAS